MRHVLIALALAAGIGAAGSAAAVSWAKPVFRLEAQERRDQRGTYDRVDAPRDPRRAERREDRREQALTEEERRALHRDIDKANRELNRRRSR
jgi:hypothetical protein